MQVRLLHALGNTPAFRVLDVSAVQADWLVARGHAERVPESAPEPAVEAGETRTVEQLTVAELRGRAAELGLSQRGSKADLIDRLTAAG